MVDMSPSNLFLSRALSNPLVTIPHSTEEEGEIVRSCMADHYTKHCRQSPWESAIGNQA